MTKEEAKSIVVSGLNERWENWREPMSIHQISIRYHRYLKRGFGRYLTLQELFAREFKEEVKVLIPYKGPTLVMPLKAWDGLDQAKQLYFELHGTLKGYTTSLSLA